MIGRTFTFRYGELTHFSEDEKRRLACLHAAQYIGFRRYRVLAYFMRGVPCVAPHKPPMECYDRVPLFELAIIFDFEGYPMRAIFERYNLKRETIH